MPGDAGLRRAAAIRCCLHHPPSTHAENNSTSNQIYRLPIPTRVAAVSMSSYLSSYFSGGRLGASGIGSGFGWRGAIADFQFFNRELSGACRGGLRLCCALLWCCCVLGGEPTVGTPLKPTQLPEGADSASSLLSPPFARFALATPTQPPTSPTLTRATPAAAPRRRRRPRRRLRAQPPTPRAPALCVITPSTTSASTTRRCTQHRASGAITTAAAGATPQLGSTRTRRHNYRRR